MVKNLRMTQQINTQSECPPLDPSFSGGDSATPSPSSSFSIYGTSLDSSVAWSQDLSSRSPMSSPQFVGSSSLNHDSMVPHMDVIMPQADYACTDILDGVAFLGDESDLIDCHHMMIEHGLPAVGMGLDGTDYREYPFQANIPLGLNMNGLPGNLLTPECTPCFSQQVFGATEARSGCPARLDADPYLTSSMDSLPQTVVPSQTIAEPMTPCSGRGPGLRSLLKAEEDSTPIELMEYEALMTPTPDDSPVTTLNARMSALRWQEGLADAGRVPSEYTRPLRPTKRGAAAKRKILDERPPLISKPKFPCTHPDCNKSTSKKRTAFGRHEHLKRHVFSVHSGKRPYYCKHCDIRFSRSDNYNSHRETHTHKNRTNVGNKYIEEEYMEMEKREKSRRLKQPRRKLKEY